MFNDSTITVTCQFLDVKNITEIAFGGFAGDCQDVGNELVNGYVIS